MPKTVYVWCWSLKTMPKTVYVWFYFGVPFGALEIQLEFFGIQRVKWWIHQQQFLDHLLSQNLNFYYENLKSKSHASKRSHPGNPK